MIHGLAWHQCSNDSRISRGEILFCAITTFSMPTKLFFNFIFKFILRFSLDEGPTLETFDFTFSIGSTSILRFILHFVSFLFHYV